LEVRSHLVWVGSYHIDGRVTGKKASSRRVIVWQTDCTQTAIMPRKNKPRHPSERRVEETGGWPKPKRKRKRVVAPGGLAGAGPRQRAEYSTAETENAAYLP